MEKQYERIFKEENSNSWEDFIRDLDSFTYDYKSINVSTKLNEIYLSYYNNFQTSKIEIGMYFVKCKERDFGFTIPKAFFKSYEIEKNYIQMIDKNNIEYFIEFK